MEIKSPPQSHEATEAADGLGRALRLSASKKSDEAAAAGGAGATKSYGTSPEKGSRAVGNGQSPMRPSSVEGGKIASPSEAPPNVKQQPEVKKAPSNSQAPQVGGWKPWHRPRGSLGFSLVLRPI